MQSESTNCILRESTCLFTSFIVKTGLLELALKNTMPGAVFFNASCIEQVFSPKY